MLFERRRQNVRVEQEHVHDDRNNVKEEVSVYMAEGKI